MAYVITSPCIGEKFGECVDVCPVDCISEGTEQYYIDPDTCIDCGACQSVCPVDAILHEEDLSAADEIFLTNAREFFSASE